MVADAVDIEDGDVAYLASGDFLTKSNDLYNVSDARSGETASFKVDADDGVVSNISKLTS